MVGIVSYLPDDEPRRSVRLRRARRTIGKCLGLFPKATVFVLAQGWKRSEAVRGAVFSMRGERLGILGARRELRREFLDSGMDCLIMVDDDAELSGSPSDGADYMAEIEAHPGCFGESNGTSLKLLSVPRSIMQEVDFPDVDPERGEGYEDRAFVGMLRSAFPGRRYRHEAAIRSNDDATGDPYSTWARTKPIGEMLKATEEFLAKRAGGPLN